MRKLSHRTFSKGMCLWWLSAGFGTVSGRTFNLESHSQQTQDIGYGDLIEDRKGSLDLPQDFRYKIVSRVGEKMAEPGLFDGMGTFPGPNGTTILLRNHEFRVGNPTSLGPFKGKEKLEERLDKELVYDFDEKGGACLGSVTTLVYTTRDDRDWKDSF